MSARSFAHPAMLKADAVNRFCRALYVAVIVQIITTVYPMVMKALDTGVYNWRAIGLAALQIAGQSGGAYLLRRFGDPSSLPTPLPPSDPGEPAADVTPPVAKQPAPKKPRKRPAPKPAAKRAPAKTTQRRSTAKTTSRSTKAVTRKKTPARAR